MAASSTHHEKSLKEDIFSTLEELIKDDFERFHFYLQQPANLEGREPLPESLLEKASRIDTVKLMTHTYPNNAGQIMMNVLKKIGRYDLLQRFLPKECQFVDQQRRSLIWRVEKVEHIMDLLLRERIITKKGSIDVLSMSTTMEKMAKLYELLDSCEPEAKIVFYKGLEQNEKYLLEDLKGVCLSRVFSEVVDHSNRDSKEYYKLTHNPRGTCLIINNEIFDENVYRDRRGTKFDEDALNSVFVKLGFEVKIHNNLTANKIRHVLLELGKQDFSMADALVVCVLTHGEKGCVFGVDCEKVCLREVTEPFRSKNARTLAGKPKLFFIQACQGRDRQEGMLVDEEDEEEADGRSDHKENVDSDYRPKTISDDADFLMGMATIQDYCTFRNINKGAIYIQELCEELEKGAAREEDILTILTRVNMEVGRLSFFQNNKQTPEYKSTLTKKLILNFI